MEFSGERFIPGMTGGIELEHLNRYFFVIYQFNLKDKKILDIACGEGYGSYLLSKFANSVIGIDIDKETITHATEKYEAENLRFLQGDAVCIPLDDNSVDCVVSFETIEHHNKHEEMLLEIKRILTKKGILVISSPDKLHYSDSSGTKNEFHAKELYYDEFKDLIKKHFEQTYFFSQRTFNGSMIVLNENGKNFKAPIIVCEDGTAKDFVPLYNIGIGTNDTSFYLENNIVIYQNSDNILTIVDIENAREDGIQKGMMQIRQTKSYSIGKFILRPYLLLKKVINDIYNYLFSK